tara:strand:+ start:32 stop:493 length:462 start_codon:yes stop_codon:yes gene_type:complete
MSQGRVELLRLWRLVDELGIDADQAVGIFPVWSQHNRERQELGNRRARIEEQVAEMLESDVGDEAESELLELIGALRQLEEEAAGIKRSFRDRMADLLTVRQQARFLLFEDRFRLDLRELVRDVRHLRSRRGGGLGGEGGDREGRGQRRGTWW